MDFGPAVYRGVMAWARPGSWLDFLGAVQSSWVRGSVGIRRFVYGFVDSWVRELVSGFVGLWTGSRAFGRGVSFIFFFPESVSEGFSLSALTAGEKLRHR